MERSNRVGHRVPGAMLAWWTGCALSAGALGAQPAPARVGPESCEIGTALALQGNLALAESVFVSLLTRAPRDPRALNNLGNLALMRDRPGVALAFYDRAAARDTSDAGVVLNQATALMLLGDEDAAQTAAVSGLTKAGGLGAAAGLLGIAAPELDPTAPAKAGGRPGPRREEMLLLLRIAAGKVPADTLRAIGSGKPRSKPPTLRSAGPRGDAEGEAPVVVYWKR